MHHTLLHHMFPFPGEKGEKFRNEAAYRMFRELFTEDEAALAAQLSFAPEAVEAIADRVGQKAQSIVPVLDKMADRGLVYADERNGTKRYCLLALFPGMAELQFMKGEESAGKRRLAGIFEEFFELIAENHYSDGTPIPRVMPVQSGIPPVLVLPYEQASTYINDSNYVAVSTCFCRHQAKLMGRWCERPLDVCMTFGPFAKFVVKHGFGKHVSTEEALNVLDRSEEAGLVHLTENCQEKINFICNCCGCCCYFMQGITKYDKPNCIATSNFLCAVDEDSCVGCETCIERCYVNALSIADEVVQVNTDRCIGCGLCTLVCPNDALSLVRREQQVVPLKDSRELRAAIVSEAMQEAQG
jgi:electron transport complex protein RnfB